MDRGEQARCAVQGGTNVRIPSDLAGLAIVKYSLKGKVFLPAHSVTMWCRQISRPLMVHFIYQVLFAAAKREH